MEDIIALIDPFSDEAKKLLSEIPSISSLPKDTEEKAINRYIWKKKDDLIPKELLDSNSLLLNIKEEIFTFFFILQALSAQRSPYSSLARFVLSCEHDILYNRLKKLIHDLDEKEVISQLSKKFDVSLIKKDRIENTSVVLPKTDLYKITDSPKVDFPRYAIRWWDLSKLFEKGISLSDYYLSSGYIILTPSMFFNLYSNFILLNAREYISTTAKKMKDVEVHHRIESFSKKLSDEFEEEVSNVVLGDTKAEKFDPTRFPPCIKIILGGLGAGNRNYGITVVLAPFLSYARLCPYPRTNVKISDCTDDLSIVNDEIMPLIEEAAAKCDPPFFADEPQEKMNIYYHLGFGLSNTPRLDDSGRSKWYMCPNCKKIQREIPIICRPDNLCSKIRNPLQYYNAKKNQ